jgi:hypothetical protein
VVVDDAELDFRRSGWGKCGVIIFPVLRIRHISSSSAWCEKTSSDPFFPVVITLELAYTMSCIWWMVRGRIV